MPLSAAVQTGARCVQCLRNEVLQAFACWGPLLAGKIYVSVYVVVYIGTKLHITVEIAYIYTSIYNT